MRTDESLARYSPGHIGRRDRNESYTGDIGRDEIIDVMELGNDSVRNLSSDRKTDTTEAIGTMLIVDGVARLEVRSELVVGVIIEVQSSECPDVWIGRRIVLYQIFEMHS